MSEHDLWRPDGELSCEERTLVSWFQHHNVALHETLRGNEHEDKNWLCSLGVLTPSQIFCESHTITARFLGGNKDFGGGWYRGGGESFYKINEIVYREAGIEHAKYVAYKALNSLSDLESKALVEAAWMTHVHRFLRCGAVYAVAPGIILKEFLIQDPWELLMSEEQRRNEESAIQSLLKSEGFVPLVSRDLQTIQSNGRLMLIDLGSGDMSGPSPLSLALRD